MTTEKTFIITETELKNALAFIDDLDKRSTDENISHDERVESLHRWRGSRQVMRRLGFNVFELEETYTA